MSHHASERFAMFRRFSEVTRGRVGGPLRTRANNSAWFGRSRLFSCFSVLALYNLFRGSVGRSALGLAIRLNTNPTRVSAGSTRPELVEGRLREVPMTRRASERLQTLTRRASERPVAPATTLPRRPSDRALYLEQRLPRPRVHERHGLPYRPRSWSEPLNASVAPSIGSEAMRDISSITARCRSSSMASSAAGAQGETSTAVPSGSVTPFSSTTTPFSTRPRITIPALWHRDRGHSTAAGHLAPGARHDV
jgi:hypothetical protein